MEDGTEEAVSILHDSFVERMLESGRVLEMEEEAGGMSRWERDWEQELFGFCLERTRGRREARLLILSQFGSMGERPGESGRIVEDYHNSTLNDGVHRAVALRACK